MDGKSRDILPIKPKNFEMAYTKYVTCQQFNLAD